jgi:hypothetical protein
MRVSRIGRAVGDTRPGAQGFKESEADAVLFLFIFIVLFRQDGGAGTGTEGERLR